MSENQIVSALIGGGGFLFFFGLGREGGVRGGLGTRCGFNSLWAGAPTPRGQM